MRHAAELLTTSHLSIDQVSFGVGYASRSSFFRAFRKVYGSDPSDYRAITLRTPDRIVRPASSARREHSPRAAQSATMIARYATVGLLA